MMSLRAICLEFLKHSWSVQNRERYYLVKFPTREGLNHTMGRTSIPCKDHKAGFSIYHWSGEEDNIIHLFPITATLAITDVPLHHWNRTDLNKLLIRFAHVIKVNDQTLDKSDISVARVRVSCDKLSVILKEFNAVFGNQMCKINIMIESTITIQ